MPRVRLDDVQRFSCRSCGRCCRAWEVPVLPPEAERCRQAKAERFFAGDEGVCAGAGDPFLPAGRGARLLKLRKRANGACGFLSADGLCAIHSELGAGRKPLACRVFPFQFHLSSEEIVVTTSFSCPTVARNQGEPLVSQARDIERLAHEWLRAFPAEPRPLLLVGKKPIDGATCGLLREALGALLSRSQSGTLDVPKNVQAMGRFLDDLCRPRVLRLDPASFCEYLRVMSRHALTGEKAPGRQPTRLARLTFRGFLLAVLGVRTRLAPEGRAASRWRRMWLQLRLLLHVHGLGPRVAGVDLRRASNLSLPAADHPVWRLAHHHLRAAIATLGTGRWAIVDELGVAAATLRAAFVLAALHTDGQPIDEAAFVLGLNDSADLHHAGSASARALIGWMAQGTESLFLLGSGRLL